MMIINFFKHLNVVNKHRYKVFKLCCKAGIPFRGLIHDLSKYSPTEFWEGVKYFDGKISPIKVCKKEHGYSKAWLHHKGRNKHHFEYWIDINTKEKTPVIPYKYTVEMICDNIAAGMTYHSKDWVPSDCLKYFEKRTDLEWMNDSIKEVLIEVYNSLIINGLDKTINKKFLKEVYNKHVK